MLKYVSIHIHPLRVSLCDSTIHVSLTSTSCTVLNHTEGQLVNACLLIMTHRCVSFACFHSLCFRDMRKVICGVLWYLLTAKCFVLFLRVLINLVKAGGLIMRI